MSNLQRIDNLKQIVKIIEPDFNKLAKIHGAVNYEREASFAMQMLNDNEYLMGMALGNQDSFKRAIINVAAIGLSLNPVQKWAYLVPRDKKVMLDVSYRGFIQLASDVGSIKWAQTEIVRETDEYEYRGIGQEPLHKFNPFNPHRGAIVGVYCLAKTHADEFMLENMNIDEVYAIRARSPSYRNYLKDPSKKTPWMTDESEMIKKTVIRKAAKRWPLTDSRVRLGQALEVSSESDPLEAIAAPVAPTEGPQRQEQIERINNFLMTLGKSEGEYLAYLVRIHRRNLKSFAELTPIEMSQSLTLLEQMIKNKEKK